MLLLNAEIESKKARGAVGLMAGTYAETNLASETGVAKHIYQAYAGVSPIKDLWIDMGVFPSPIGFESANPVSNWTLTRSLAAENSPYYLTGAKATYKWKKWLFSSFLVNGWQTIREKDNYKDYGFQVTYTGKRSLLNLTGYSGKIDVPLRTAHYTIMRFPVNRYYLNSYWIVELNPKLGLTLGYDIGFQESTSAPKHQKWHTAVLILKEKISEKLELAERVEFFEDHSQQISAMDLKRKPVYGLSFNVDYLFSSHIRWRLEPRLLISERNVFANKNTFVNEEFFITSSFLLSF